MRESGERLQERIQQDLEEARRPGACKSLDDGFIVLTVLRAESKKEWWGGVEGV